MTFNLVTLLWLKTTVKGDDLFPQPLQNKKKQKTAQRYSLKLHLLDFHGRPRQARGLRTRMRSTNKVYLPL